MGSMRVVEHWLIKGSDDICDIKGAFVADVGEQKVTILEFVAELKTPQNELAVNILPMIKLSAIQEMKEFATTKYLGCERPPWTDDFPEPGGAA